MRVLIVLVAVCILSLFSCERIPEPSEGFVQTDGTVFIDNGGREMIFNGVNMICKDPRKKYTDQFSREEFYQLASWGFNVVRLGIIWSGIEPNPGEYDETYLAQFDQLVEWATEAGIYVLIDMHQDLFGQKFSDGAPDWATLDMDMPHHTGAIWSDSYMISPAVQASFDNFWANSHAADGIGVQDRYVAMWKMLAEKYAEEPGVLGYDLMNEPFMGVAATKVMPLMIQAYANETMDIEAAWHDGTLDEDVMKLAERWATEKGRLDILRRLNNKEVYARVIESAAPLCRSFEENELKYFYQKLRDTIREVDKKHILFLEHNYFANTGISSNIVLPVDENGEPDALLAYAAHGYDLVTDTKEVGAPSHARIEFIFNRINETSKKLDIPLLIGEWGAYGGDHPQYRETADEVINIFEKMHCSHTYWNYDGKGFSEMHHFQVLNRVYPIAVAGQLIAYHYDNNSGGFSIEIKTSGREKYSSQVFIPDIAAFNENKLNFSHDSEIRIVPVPEGSGGYLFILPDGFAGERKLQYN